jgi:hypothetical protein
MNRSHNLRHPTPSRLITLGVVGAHPIYIAGAITALVGATLLWLPKTRGYARATMQKRRSGGGLIKPRKPVAWTMRKGTSVARTRERSR